jgi:hypothetical protein
MSSNGWIGVDLDGTLAHYESFGDGGIGAPIKPMVRRIKHYLKQGKDVRILTARAATFDDNKRAGGLQIWFDFAEFLKQKARIDRFCTEQFGQVLRITASKDYHMYMLLDDRAMQVIPNKGILVLEELRRAATALAKIAYSETDPAKAGLIAAEAFCALDPWSRELVRTSN